MLTYRVNPEQLQKEKVLFDLETLVSTVGPGCYFCETPYSSLLASRRCKGEPGK